MNASVNMPITRERIVNASWELLRECGIEQFTMRKLAKQLDIKAASLYWHFQSKQQIFQFLANEIAQKVVLSAQNEGDWKEQLYRFGNHFRNQLEKYPCSAHLMIQTVPSGAQYIDLINHMLKIVEPLPISDRGKFSSIACVLNFVLSFELDKYQQHKNDVAMKGVRQEIEPTVGNLPEPLRRMYLNGVFSDLGSDSMFQTGLKILIFGIEQLSMTEKET
ncbi:TetR/AcrR family transcriptional regulator [Alicyclobacillus acidiphilus]|uniref:TetR/AcrR family transcriptional regulator n=1 Tax=Alicyclobacillus acidiphilus TaxID=182455 RepID=UPI000831E80E|nr:TetR/AcrR family transcriptional regulator C-terminal domain-containing protein [Alicyclobacillus acidiphilus]